ncbi:MAG: hypothetical protein Q9225_003207 [Loekoesia sp. 1 TL-2023]
MIIGSLILRYAHENPHLPQPFRAVIFMNSDMPWSATEDLGKDVTPLVIQNQYVPPTETDANHAIAQALEKNKTIEDMLNDERNANWEDGELIPPMMRYAYKNIHAQDVEKGVSRTYDDYRAHRMFAEVDKVRVPVPTGHILGEQDPLREFGEAMEKMCEPGLMLSFKHRFGHEIPARSPRDLRRIKEVIEKTVLRSELSSHGILQVSSSTDKVPAVKNHGSDIGGHLQRHVGRYFKHDKASTDNARNEHAAHDNYAEEPDLDWQTLNSKLDKRATPAETYEAALCQGEKMWARVQSAMAGQQPAGEVFQPSDINNGWTRTRDLHIPFDDTFNDYFNLELGQGKIPPLSQISYIELEQLHNFRDRKGEETPVKLFH